ncbi:D-glycero-beta-D-manno-heptose 1-phosphate adenylyltransferase [bacterium]|nr:D-glycero-beta-D-manno-heptose 1-phosphate adenylyltransferase [bacterium]
MLTIDRAAGFAASLRSQGIEIISTNGCFDLLHVGHTSYLERARLLGDKLWVGLNSDASVRRLKGSTRPVQDQNARALQLASLESVDFVTIFDEDTPEAFLEKIRPTVHAKGGDYDPSALPERGVVEKGGGKVVCLPLVSGFSTTELIRKLQQAGDASL